MHGIYLIDNVVFQVLEMFRIAFRSRLMFTIGDSVTTGMKDVVVWNCIHNKTSIYGGPQKFVPTLSDCFATFANRI